MLNKQLSVLEDNLEGTEKLRELVLYLCALSERDGMFGSVKLNKLLFYCDFLSYLHSGKSMTGQEYQKLKQGPAPRLMLPLVRDMTAATQLALSERRYFRHLQKRPIALREADLSRFTAQEIATVNQVLRLFQDHNGAEMSALSHELPSWQLAEEGETIPYSSALLHRHDLTAQEQQWAQELDLTGVEELLCA